MQLGMKFKIIIELLSLQEFSFALELELIILGLNLDLVIFDSLNQNAFQVKVKKN